MNSPVQTRLLRLFMIGQARNSIWDHSVMKIICPLMWRVLSTSSLRSISSVNLPSLEVLPVELASLSISSEVA